MIEADAASTLVAGRGRAPSLVLLGAPRSGTTALATWLRDAGLGVGVKDSFYLMDDDAGLRGPTHLSTHGVRGYLDLFPTAVEPTAEFAAGYLYQQTAHDFFSRWAEPPRFAVVVRDPVERLRSVHRYFSGNLGLLPADMDFAGYVDALFAESLGLPDKTVSDALDQGLYLKALEPWLDTFGPEHVHVFQFEQVDRSPRSVMTEFLALAGCAPRIDLQAYGFETYNTSYVPRSPLVAKATAWGRRWIPSGKLRSWGGEKLRRLQSRGGDVAASPKVEAPDPVIERLHEFYREPNAALGDRFGIDVSGWL